MWEKTDEPLFLSEERERELELSLDSSVTAALNEPVRRIGSGVDADAEADDGMDVEGVRKATSETLMAGEKIMEALEMEDDAAEIGARGGEKSQYVYEVVRKVPAASMEDALVVLPFSAVAGLLGHLDAWAVRVSAVFGIPSPSIPTLANVHIYSLPDLVLTLTVARPDPHLAHPPVPTPHPLVATHCDLVSPPAAFRSAQTPPSRSGPPARDDGLQSRRAAVLEESMGE